eukprot:scaffold59452_cov66-Phaeocystis_antarctica.AAC.3
MRRGVSSRVDGRRGISDIGGNQLEHPGQWRGAQWPGPPLPLGVPSRPEPDRSGAPRGRSSRARALPRGAL